MNKLVLIFIETIFYKIHGQFHNDIFHIHTIINLYNIKIFTFFINRLVIDSQENTMCHENNIRKIIIYNKCI